MAEVTMKDDEYMELLNDVYGSVSICGITYCAGYALRYLDPTAFNMGKSAYEDSMEDESEADEKE